MAEKATNQDWLDQVQEEALEPELPIIDPHHHLWDQKVGRVNPKYFLEEKHHRYNKKNASISKMIIIITGQDGKTPIKYLLFIGLHSIFSSYPLKLIFETYLKHLKYVEH